jgi:enoyl-CoA hydratase/carnithine racemase
LSDSELVTVEHDGTVTVVRLCSGENRFRPDSLGAIDAALDAVEADQERGGLVLTGTGKFFSNGLDLEWMGSAEDGRETVLTGLHALLARLVTFPMVTVAAINGHAYAGGAMLALACDFRVMRGDRGYFCLPEADLGLPFTVGMSDLLRAKMSPSTATAAMVFGTRYSAGEALTAGLVDEVADEDAVVAAAVRRAATLAGKNRRALGTIKQRLYADAVTALGADTFVF